MIGWNLKNTQDALNYLSKMEALDGQPNFKRDRLSLDQQDYNPGPRHCQATEQSDERCRTDVQVRQINYSGGGQSNSRWWTQESPSVYRGRNSSDHGRRVRDTQGNHFRDYERWDLDPWVSEFKPGDGIQPVPLWTERNEEGLNRVLTCLEAVSLSVRRGYPSGI